MKTENSVRYRFEAFGGILALEDPPLVAFVDEEFMRERGLGPSALWGTARKHLTAPIEAHFATTNACNFRCPGCYMASGRKMDGEYDTAGARRVLSTLAAQGVFHVALGGGEATLREDLFEIAAHARSVGIVPNLTTNGTLVSEANAARFRVFGQVNVSVDAVGAEADRTRDPGTLDASVRALRLLRGAGVAAGINCVLHRHNFDRMGDVVALAAELGLAEVEFLRYKPAGRGKERYHEMKLLPEQGQALLPTILKLLERHRVELKVDCSFVPFLAAHAPPLELLQRFGVYGCEAGNVLLAVRPDGRLSGCSFIEETCGRVEGLPEAWEGAAQFRAFRSWTEAAPEPCSSCPYLSVCRGGCRAVAIFAGGGFAEPDPECPRVLAHRAAGEGASR